MVKAYHIGFVIKQKREEKGISQKELCKGICDHSTLSRIERGKHEPSVTTLKMLLQRLGLDDEEFSILLGPKDFEITNLQKEIVALNAQKQFEQAAENCATSKKLQTPRTRSYSSLFFVLKCLHSAGQTMLLPAKCLPKHCS